MTTVVYIFIVWLSYRISLFLYFYFMFSQIAVIVLNRIFYHLSPEYASAISCCYVQKCILMKKITNFLNLI